jgi:hypothetical protein
LANSSARPPRNHHFIPIFYLKRWTTEGQLIEFCRRRFDQVIPRKTYPAGTGYVRDLYSALNEDSERVTTLETNFLAPADGLAALALEQLHQIKPKPWAAPERSAWSRFIMTLLLRTPEDIRQLKENFRNSWGKVTPEMEDGYARRRKSGDPSTLKEAFDAMNTSALDLMALDIGSTLMNHPKIGDVLNNMQWHTLDVSGSAATFLTSDRPVIMSATLSDPEAYVVMPIGPHKLFVAVNQSNVFERIAAKPIDAHVETINQLVVRHAARFVFGSDQTQLQFIQDNMGRAQEPSLMTRLSRLPAYQPPAT